MAGAPAGAAKRYDRLRGADALGDVEAPTAQTTLIERADVETDPRVMLVLADAIGRPSPLSPEATGALLRLLARGDSATVVVVAGVFADHAHVEALLDLVDAHEDNDALPLVATK